MLLHLRIVQFVCKIKYIASSTLMLMSHMYVFHLKKQHITPNLLENTVSLNFKQEILQKHIQTHDFNTLRTETKKNFRNSYEKHYVLMKRVVSLLFLYDFLGFVKNNDFLT